MKTLKITLLGLTLGLMSFSIHPVQKSTTVKIIATAPLTWKNESIDLGEIPQGTPKLLNTNLKIQVLNQC